MKISLFSNILMICGSLIVTLSAQAQTIGEDEIIPGGSGINQLSENIQSLLEPVGGGGGGLLDPGESLGVEQDDNVGDGDGQVPVDGGLSLLLAAGAAYGARKVRRRKEMK